MFSEFYACNFKDQGYELYFIKDNTGNAMYVGISKDSVWRRWFGGGTSHMDTNAEGELYGRSYVGEVIQRRFPESWDWIVELWTKEDCVQILGDRFRGKDIEKLGIDSIEPYIIIKFEPLYNVMHGGGRHDDPLISKKLDEAYKKLFG